MVEIRLIRHDDYEEIYRMGKTFMTVSKLIDKYGWERQSIRKLVNLFVENQSFFCLVAEEDNKLVGMLAVIIAPHLFNNDLLVAEELAWWVEPDFRNGIGDKMLALAEKALTKKGVKHFSMKLLDTGIMKPNVMKRLYKLKGYNEAEILVSKEL